MLFVGTNNFSKSHCVLTMAESYTEQNENEIDMINKVKRFLQEGCGCTKGAKDRPCSSYFSEESVTEQLLQINKHGTGPGYFGLYPSIHSKILPWYVPCM